MTRQKTINLRLLYLLVGLIVISILISFMTGDDSDNLNLDRTSFRLSNTIDINKVQCETNGKTTLLEFSGGKWMLNNAFEADPSRVHLLFAALQNVNIRRPVSPGQIKEIDSLFKAQSTEIQFFAGDQLSGSIETCGDIEKGITYFRSDEGIYLMEIPGYRTYIHGLISVDLDDWRNKNLFHKMSWRNLGKISVTFPKKPKNNFSISRKNQLFSLDQLAETDTTKLFDYIDYISLMDTESYVEDTFMLHTDPEIVIDVRDVGNRSHLMEIYPLALGADELLGRMDSTDYFTLKMNQYRSLLLSPEEFKK